MSRRRAALAALLLAAVAATVPGGCTNRADDTSGGGGISLPSFPSVELRMDSVVMVGDSITEGSAIVLQDTLTTAGFSDVVVDGDASRRIEVGTGAGGGPVSGLRTILRLIAEGASPDVWVIELGTNDIGAYTEAEYRDPYVKELIDAKGWAVWPPVRFSYDTINYDLPVPAPSPPARSWFPSSSRERKRGFRCASAPLPRCRAISSSPFSIPCWRAMTSR